MNLMDEWLQYVQELDPLWAVVPVAAALGVLLLARLWRPSFAYLFAGLAAFVAVGGLAAAGYYGFVYFEDQKRLEERRALDERAARLFIKTVESDSVFACIDGSPAPAMLEACERRLFAEPQRIAAAVAIVTQRLVLLDDALAFVAERDPGYAEQIAPMRNAIESDPYGFVAFVLSVEHGCTHEKCGRFSLLRDPARVRENMRVRRLEAYLAKHSTIWRGTSELPADLTPTVGRNTSSPLVTISGEPTAAPAGSREEEPAHSAEPVAAATNDPPVPPALLPLVPPPSAASVAAEPPAAALAPVVAPAEQNNFTEPPRPAEPAPTKASKGNGAKAAATRPIASQSKSTQASSKARSSDARRSSEPVAGLPRVVPSDYIRDAEEKEEASEQSAAPAAGAPTPISPQQNFTGN